MGQKRQGTNNNITEVKKKERVKIYRAYDYSLLFLTIFFVIQEMCYFSVEYFEFFQSALGIFFEV